VCGEEKSEKTFKKFLKMPKLLGGIMVAAAQDPVAPDPGGEICVLRAQNKNFFVER
jgi:hypothetical protein